MSQSFLFKIVLLAFSLILFACTPQEKEVVTLYTSIPSSIIPSIEEAFEEAHPNIDLEVFRAGTSDVLARMEEDLANGKIEADLIWVADFSVGEDLKNRNLLLEYVPPEANDLLDIFRDTDDFYYGARLLNMVIAYNTELVDTPPENYHDLLDSRFQGQIAHASPIASGAFEYFMGTLLQQPEFGAGYFRQLANNEPVIQNNSQTLNLIASGDIAVGITIDYIARNHLLENPDAPIDIVYPESGVVMVPSPIAIFADAPNIEGAKVFESYMLSKDGQTLLRDIAGVMPVRLDVAPPGNIESITQLPVLLSDPIWISTNREDIRRVFEISFGDS